LCIAVIAGLAAEPDVQVVRVCEVLQDLQAHAGKPLAIVGRFSFRETGRYLSEEGCAHKLKFEDFVWPSVLRLAFDSDGAPKLPQPLVLDEQTIVRKLKQAQRATALRQFRFGSPDYDRWAMVYGRLDPARELNAKPSQAKKDALGPSPADLVCRGEGVIIFLDSLQ